jgi:uncharacterized membrane protein YgcG
MMRPTIRLRCVSASAGAIAFFLQSAAVARTVELRNDVLQDNGDASAVCAFAVGEKFAARFTPPSYPARLLKVRVLLSNVALSPDQCATVDVDTQIDMPMEVFHVASSMPGTSLGEFSGYAYSSAAVLNEIDVNAANLTIDDGSFVVAYTLVQDDASPVHDASKAADKAANFIYGDLGLGARWYSFEDLAGYGADPQGNWVVRVDVSVPDDVDAGAGGSGGDGGSAGAGGADAGGASGEGGSGGSAGASASGGSGGAAGAGGSSSDAGGAAAPAGSSADDDGGCTVVRAGAPCHLAWSSLAAAIGIGLSRLARRRRNDRSPAERERRVTSQPSTSRAS